MLDAWCLWSFCDFELAGKAAKLRAVNDFRDTVFSDGENYIPSGMVPNVIFSLFFVFI